MINVCLLGAGKCVLARCSSRCFEALGFYLAISFYKLFYLAAISHMVVSVSLRPSTNGSSPQVRERLRFEISDITEREYRDASYDVIYSRETLLHVEDKRAVLAKFCRWLRPGGRLLITDYCQGEGKLQNEFLEYKSARGEGEGDG